MERYEKIVLEAGKGITFEVSEGTNGELLIRAIKVATAANGYSTNKVATAANGYSTNKVATAANGYSTNKVATAANGYSTNYVNPPIPEGYEHVCGEWDSGFVIERCSDRSQFVWIPVGSLDSNGTLDGKDFSEKFGRRNYMNDEFADYKFNEPLNDELLEQLESVKRYGGFYISRYNISRGLEGKPQSVKGVKPLVRIDFDNAKKLASTIEDNEAVKSHLTFGAEYDSVLEWFVESGVKTLDEIAADSTKWGNHRNTENFPMIVARTGSRAEWRTNNIYDFAGNVSEWTQEKRGCSLRVIRGGNCFFDGNYYPVASRTYAKPYFPYFQAGLRATLYIK